MADSIRKKKHPLVNGKSREGGVSAKPGASASSIAKIDNNSNYNRVALTSQKYQQSAQSNQETLVVKLDDKADEPSETNPYYATSTSSNKKKIKMFGQKKFAMPNTLKQTMA